jgi:hypothetical protein
MEFKKEELKQVFSEKFEGLIWNIRIHEKNGYMAVESRHLESRNVAFTVLDLQTGEIFFKERTYLEPMNLNLAYAAPDNLILTANEHTESPESKGLISINILNGEILWERYNFSFNQADSSGLQVYDPKIFPRNYLWINHLNAENINKQENSPYAEDSDLLFPDLFETYTLPDFIEYGQIVGEISVLLNNGLSIVSFHQKFENNMQQRLVVYQDDRIFINDIIIDGIQKLQPESFFMIKNSLLYVRNKNEIVSYFV